MPEFQSFLQKITVSLIAIDESHCISEWGHDFRPDYRNLHLLRTRFPEVPVMALTATATQKVREDIICQLSLDKAKIFISSFNRPNLSYAVLPKKDSYDQLMDILRERQNESAIIYCFSRKDTEHLAADLRQEGFRGAGLITPGWKARSAAPIKRNSSGTKRRLSWRRLPSGWASTSRTCAW